MRQFIYSLASQLTPPPAIQAAIAGRLAHGFICRPRYLLLRRPYQHCARPHQAIIGIRCRRAGFDTASPTGIGPAPGSGQLARLLPPGCCRVSGARPRSRRVSSGTTPALQSQRAAASGRPGFHQPLPPSVAPGMPTAITGRITIATPFWQHYNITATRPGQPLILPLSHEYSLLPLPAARLVRRH